MKINILQGAFFPVPPVNGGAIESAWYLLGKEFAKNGHEVNHVCKSDKRLQISEINEGVKYLRVRGAKAVRNPLLLKLMELPYVLRTKRVMQEADILISHTFWAPILFPQKKYGRIYVHVGRHPKGQLNLYGKACRLQVPSSSIAKACQEEVPTQFAKIKTLPYPLPWKASKEFVLQNREKTFLYVGRIHPEKGVLELIEAWHKIPKEVASGWKLLVVGPWREEHGGGGSGYLKKIKTSAIKGNNQIEISSPIFDRHKLKKQMEKVCFFVYPSRAHKGETFGLAVLEAMSCGCVPIVSSLPCFSDFIDFEKQGLFIDEKFSESFQAAITQKLLEAISLPAGKLYQMAQSSWNRSKDYEIENVAQLYLNDFSSLIKKSTKYG